MRPESLQPAQGPATTRVLLTDTARWATPARLTISLAKVGFDVSAVCPVQGHPLLKTRAVGRTFDYSPIYPLKSLRAAIDAVAPHLIVPCDDRAVQHLHELYAEERRRVAPGGTITALIERSLGAPQSYHVATSRYDLLNIAREEGIRVPETGAINTAEDFAAWSDRAPFPWVLKADGTFGGRGVRIAHSLEEAQLCLRELNGMFGLVRASKRMVLNRDSFWFRPWWNDVRPAITVQSHITGHPANCGVVCWEGKVLAGIGVDVISTSGLTNPATVVKVVDSPEMKLAAELIARRLGLSGFFGLDFMIDHRSDAAYLIEMNPRCTPVCHLQLGKGRDLVSALWAHVSGSPLADTPPVTQNSTIAYFPQAWAGQSSHLATSFEDVPWEEPDLVQELLHPWPDRTLFCRAFNSVSTHFGRAAQRVRNWKRRSKTKVTKPSSRADESDIAMRVDCFATKALIASRSDADRASDAAAKDAV